MTSSNEVVGSHEESAVSEVLKLIECSTVDAGLTKLLGLSLERERLDKISEGVYCALKGMNSAKARYWNYMYNSSIALGLSESPGNCVQCGIE